MAHIRIISPSGAIDESLVQAAAMRLRAWGYTVSEGRYARNRYGRFAGTKSERLADLQEAIDDPQVDIILCSRGGYGLMQIIDKVDFRGIGYSDKSGVARTKRVVGFSDITVLHNTLGQFGIPSIHGPMCKQIAELPDTDESLTMLQALWQNQLPSYTVTPYPENRVGRAKGILRGGNLSILNALRQTPCDLVAEEAILFIEDIAEEPYHIDRMMQNLRLSGVLSKIRGLVVGYFTNCIEDESMNQTIREIILAATEGCSYPICFGFRAGHEQHNLPLLLNSAVELSVNRVQSHLRFL